MPLIYDTTALLVCILVVALYAFAGLASLLSLF